MNASPPPVTCTYHPGVETTLRCNRCDKPICPKCAVRTPTGYRCKDCVQSQQKIFITARWYDYIIGFLAGGFLSTIANFLVVLVSSITGFFSWIIIAAGAPSVAIAIAEALRFVTRRHRSKPLFNTVIASIILGALPVAVVNLITLNLWGLLFQAIYLVISVPIIYTRLSGLHFTGK